MSSPNGFGWFYVRAIVAGLCVYFGFTLIEKPDDALLYWLGYALIIIFGFGLIKNFILISISSRHSAAQLDLDTMSKTVSTVHGSSRLARSKDNFVQKLTQCHEGLFLGALYGELLFFDPFARGNGNMMVYAPARGGKTSKLIINNVLNWFREA